MLVHPNSFDKFTRMTIDGGPYEGDKYLFALYFDSSFEATTKEKDILFSLRYCRMYPGEPEPIYGPNEYRRIYRSSLPTDLPEGTVQDALDEYNQRRRPVATATERFLAKPLK